MGLSTCHYCGVMKDTDETQPIADYTKTKRPVVRTACDSCMEGGLVSDGQDTPARRRNVTRPKTESRADALIQQKLRAVVS